MAKNWLRFITNTLSDRYALKSGDEFVYAYLGVGVTDVYFPTKLRGAE